MKRWQIILGIVLIVFGVFSLVETAFKIDLWRYLWPLVLVGLGLLLILRPRIAGSNVHVEMPLLGEFRRTGAWEATKHEIWWVVGTTYLDFTEAVFPEGDATIRVYGFVAEVKITLPEEVGLAVGASSFVTELKSPEGTEERIMNSIEYQSPNYLEAEKRVNLQTVAFVSEIQVKRLSA